MPRAINYCLIAQKVVHLHPHRGAKEKKSGAKVALLRNFCYICCSNGQTRSKNPELKLIFYH